MASVIATGAGKKKVVTFKGSIGELTKALQKPPGGKDHPALQDGGSAINHPAHYNQGKIECIEFIEDQNLGFHLGNAIKYVVRAGKKDKSWSGIVDDLDKAIWYLKRQRELVVADVDDRAPVRPNDMGKA